MKNTEIFKTEFQAIREAKSFFAGILGIRNDSVHVAHDRYYERKYGSTQCVCGQTTCYFFKMANAGPVQQKKLNAVIDRPGAVIALGVCESCGKNYGDF
jgi:hypothetical protein